MIIIGDVHGCYKTLLALINKLPKDQEIVFVGDLIDRGLNSKEVVQLIMDNKFQSVKGNHEDMLHQYTEGCDFGGIWFSNGGRQTLWSYQDKDGICEIPNDHYDFLINLPAVIQKDNILISHSNIAVYETLEESIQTKNIMWNRCKPNVPEGIFHVFGHTPNMKPDITENYANIDTGCFFSHIKGYGTLTALQLPEMIIYQQKNIE